MMTATSTRTVQRTLGAYYTAKLTFFHDFPVKVWGAYYTNVRIMFEFFRYQFCGKTAASVENTPEIFMN